MPIQFTPDQAKRLLDNAMPHGTDDNLIIVQDSDLPRGVKPSELEGYAGGFGTSEDYRSVPDSFSGRIVHTNGIPRSIYRREVLEKRQQAAEEISAATPLAETKYFTEDQANELFANAERIPSDKYLLVTPEKVQQVMRDVPNFNLSDYLAYLRSENGKEAFNTTELLRDSNGQIKHFNASEATALLSAGKLPDDGNIHLSEEDFTRITSKPLGQVENYRAYRHYGGALRGVYLSADQLRADVARPQTVTADEPETPVSLAEKEPAIQAETQETKTKKIFSEDKAKAILLKGVTLADKETLQISGADLREIVGTSVTHKLEEYEAFIEYKGTQKDRKANFDLTKLQREAGILLGETRVAQIQSEQQIDEQKTNSII